MDTLPPSKSTWSTNSSTPSSWHGFVEVETDLLPGDTIQFVLLRLGATMRFSINIPNFGDFADAHTVGWVATAAALATSRIKLGPPSLG
ncbi:hypothetical protein EV644_11524 [Kribbella orskensis]|uniref:Activator of Hsp90 ATPase-like protein n=1 Tax=Kribbella orskensis TaxID=2512216 RepID=A0ABY2BDB9_9ACTN|nr:MULTISPECIES: hypothetical protein [Kribbella]TCN35462.1 hypothetical protein EV642_11624 [Kribbella sp. VKM Ac-2500]TCO17004.1 hypothetical protein EV644_11524 [Kribbella orskensis]